MAIERRHFDAWGNLAKLQQNGVAIVLPTDGTATKLLFLDRGYTSHEHLSEVGLIHMNGRLYDPVLRSFLMPDNFIQQPENTQNYNRYAYVLNNPLMYTDPSGEIIPFLVAVAIGAAVSATVYTLTALMSDVPFSVGGLLKATFIGAASAAVTFGIGSASTALFTNFFSKAAFQAVAHGTFQGTVTAISGGKFWSGFAAGALSSIASSLYSGGQSMDGLGKNASAIAGTGFNSIGDNLGDVGMIAFGTVAGGAGAALTGGNFWQGAVTGLVVSGLNHAMHQMDNDDIVRINTKDKTATVETTGDNYDRIFVDGKEVMATPRGALGPDLRGAGYDISMKGPQGVGMGLTDLALEVFGAKGLGLFTRATVSSSYGAKLFESKLLGYASKNFGRYHSKFVPNGVKGVSNNGFIRTGWSNNGATHTFRTAIGHNPNQLMKIDWFWKP